MKVLSRAKWLDLWRRTGARAFERAAAHGAPAEPIGRPVVLCSRELRSKRTPQVLRLELGAMPAKPTTAAAGLWRAQSAVEPHRYAAAAIVAPARFFKAVKRGQA